MLTVSGTEWAPGNVARSAATSLRRNTRIGESTHACIRPPLAFAVQETTDVGQERHEFAVVPLLELRGVAAELVAELSPRMVGARLRQRLPMLLDLRALA